MQFHFFRDFSHIWYNIWISIRDILTISTAMSSLDLTLPSKTYFGIFYDRNRKRSRNRNVEQGYGSGSCWVKMIRFRFRNSEKRCHVSLSKIENTWVLGSVEIKTWLERYCPAKTKVGKTWYQSIGRALTLNRWYSYFTSKGKATFNLKNSFSI